MGTAKKHKGNTGQIDLVMLPVEKVRPNAWNPNRLPEDDYRNLVEAVRATGQLPKPLVVCRDGDEYLTLDGEHGLRAGKDAGLAEVPCQVVEADEFERRRQTYVRNVHGRPNPVLLGRMFAEMKEIRKLSNYDLAAEVGVSEGSVRNALVYAEVAGQRARHAAGLGRPEQQVIDEVATLPVQVVRTYLDMPEEVRDVWLDNGGEMSEPGTALPPGPMDTPRDEAKADGARKAGRASPKGKPRKSSWSRKVKAARPYRRGRQSRGSGKTGDRPAAPAVEQVFTGGLVETPEAPQAPVGDAPQEEPGDADLALAGEAAQELAGLEEVLGAIDRFLEHAAPEGTRRLAGALLGREKLAAALGEAMAARQAGGEEARGVGEGEA